MNAENPALEPEEREPSSLDPILEARLDLLLQVLNEVRDIRNERSAHKQRLDALDQFLKPGGDLQKLRNLVLVNVRDAKTRVEVVVGSNNGDEDVNDTRGDEEEDPGDIESTFKILERLDKLVNSDWEAKRREAYGNFGPLQEWSIAGLDETRLKDAMDLYDTAYWEIRNSRQPWTKYEEQMRNRGEQLFYAYRELLGSIAVRGIRIIDELAADRKGLLNLLLKPLDSAQDLPQLPAPNLLTRSEHVQLGYLGWSLWAMPLLGREAGLHLIRQDTFRSAQIASAHHVICADTYAAYVLGPSYVAAALFLELDPDGSSIGDAPSDPVRAELLLDLLPELAAGPQRDAVTRFTDRLRDAWQQARVAIGAPEIVVSDEVYEVTRKFRAAVDQKYPEGPYDMGNLSNRVEEAQAFAEGRQRVGTGAPRDVLVSMWWARVHGLGDCATIDRTARNSMSPGSSSAPNPAKAGSVGTGRTPS
jgi:hypothetical protein